MCMHVQIHVHVPSKCARYHFIGVALLGEPPGKKGDQEVLEPETSLQGECPLSFAHHKLPAGKTQATNMYTYTCTHVAGIVCMGAGGGL